MHGSLQSRQGNPSGSVRPRPYDLVLRADGQSIVEFALALPFLLLILLGAIDLARAFQTQIVVTNAARESARYGSTHPTDPLANFQQIANAEATGSGVSVNVTAVACFPLDTSSPIPCATAQNGERLQVTAKADFRFATLYLFHLSTITITKLASMPIITGGAPTP